jgi:hypothetical protein
MDRALPAELAAPVRCEVDPLFRRVYNSSSRFTYIADTDRPSTRLTRMADRIRRQLLLGLAATSVPTPRWHLITYILTLDLVPIGN